MLSAPKARAVLRASWAGSLRSDQSFSVTKATPDEVFCANDSTSKPAIENTFSTAGFFRTPSITVCATLRLRSSDAAGGSIVTSML